MTQRTLKDLTGKELFILHVELSFTGTTEQLLKNSPSIALVQEEIERRKSGGDK